MKPLQFTDFFEKPSRAGQPYVPHQRVSQRATTVLNAVAEPGSCVVLVGEPGNSKTRLAEQAAHLLGGRNDLRAHVVTLAEPTPEHPTTCVFSETFGDWINLPTSEASGPRSGAVTLASSRDTASPDTAGFSYAAAALASPQTIVSRILRSLRSEADGRDIVIVAPGVDRYSKRSTALLEAIISFGEVRVIATARRLMGTADRIARDRAGSIVGVGPLGPEEANECATEILGVERIEDATLQRWIGISGGNVFALSTLVAACDFGGVVHRRRGIAWVAAGAEVMPREFVDYLHTTCSVAEQRTLAFVALAEPLSEVVLIRQLDPECVSSLFSRGLLSTRLSPARQSSMVVSHPLIASAVIEQLSGTARIEMNDQIFSSLRESASQDARQILPGRLLRLVSLGMSGEVDLSFGWLSAAFSLVTHDVGNPGLAQKIAVRMLFHREAEIAPACEAALFLRRQARFINDTVALHRSTDFMRYALDEWSDHMTLEHHIGLQVTLTTEKFWDGGSKTAVLTRLRQINEEHPDLSPELSYHVLAHEAFVLAACGRLRESAELNERRDDVDRDSSERGFRASALFIAAFYEQQQGHVREAIELAEHGRRFSLIGELPRVDIAEIHGFAMLLAFWGSGNTEAGRHLLRQLSESREAESWTLGHYSGLYETASVLFAVCDGRWNEALQDAEALLFRLNVHDSYGVVTLVHAAAALAHAALGEREQAWQLLRAAETIARGFSEALGGYVRVLRLRAKQWLHADGVVRDADSVIAWAQVQRLPMIELQALHVKACVQDLAGAEVVERAEYLAESIGPLLGDTIRQHIVRISQAESQLGSDEVLAAKLLAELGIWLPLPLADDLTSREREIALHASFGYSSRAIAERLHISARTVETHLGRVFAKLGVENRDELRRWFVHDSEDPWEITPLRHSRTD